jgi:hypothetical protein
MSVEVFGPVETETGEAMRQAALSAMTSRYRELAERSKAEFRFSEIERQHMLAMGSALQQIQAMAPVGPLVPADAKDWFSR